ncbi:unnamed protein product [Polarella glacialis]|uniref:Uncharacterized protein n=1 Tax=Polarella glacialis TaxID=89957 RepID=A0A813HDS9_POLGL|nr:unnamed protein product [Polarella glacialis]
MAKGGAKPKSKAVKRAIAETKRPIKEAETLLAAQAEAEPAKKRRQLGRRASDEQVERSIQQNLGDLPRTVIESKKIGGLLLRERIKRDRHLAKTKTSGGRLGAVYWRGFHQEYGEGLDGVGKLTVDDQDLPVSDALLEALEAAVRVNPATRTIEPLVGHLQRCKGLNQKEFVGLCKAVSSTQAMGKTNSDSVLVEMMKFLVRAKQETSPAKEIQSMVPLFDGSLSRQFCRLKKAGVLVTTWLDTHHDLAAMLMDGSDLVAVIAAHGQWTGVAPQVARLTASSKLGSALFSFASFLVNSSSYEQEIAKLLELLLQSPLLASAVSDFQETCEALAVTYKSAGLLAAKR